MRETLEQMRAASLACAYAHARGISHQTRQAQRWGAVVAESACMIDDAYAYLKCPAIIAGDTLAVEFFRAAEEYAAG